MYEVARKEIEEWERRNPGHHGVCGLPHKYCKCRDQATKKRINNAFELDSTGRKGARMLGIVFEDIIKSMPTEALEKLPLNRKPWRVDYVLKELKVRRRAEGPALSVWERVLED